MSQGKQYILAVPNFSDGRRAEVIEEVTSVLKNVEGVKLVSVEPEHDFNRTVVTVIGEPQPLKKALKDMAKKCYELIDMTQQSGTHPRIGAQDTIPLFPLQNIDLESVKKLAFEIGNELFEETGCPIFFAAENASNEERKALAFIRKGQYEGLRDLLKNGTPEEIAARKPDLSKDDKLSEKWGATIVSADNEGLTAYNIFLATENLDVAKAIAKGLRGPSGGFSTVRAVGIKFPERNGVVVSMNMLDAGATPLYRALNFVRSEAARYGVAVTGTELVGPIKLDYVLNSFEYLLQLEGFKKEQILEYHLMG